MERRDDHSGFWELEVVNRSLSDTQSADWLSDTSDAEVGLPVQVGRCIQCIHSHFETTRNQIGRESRYRDRGIKVCGSVDFVIWSEQPAIETTTRIDISVRNYVVHA